MQISATNKVEAWLRQHPEGHEQEPLSFMQTWELPHIGFRYGTGIGGGQAFTLIDTQTIAISPVHGYPGLSVAYLGLDKTPVTLSSDSYPRLTIGPSGPTVEVGSDQSYRSPILLREFKEQYLATTSCAEGCIRLWDLQKYTSKVVYDFRQKHRRRNLCLIDDTTVACYDLDLSQNKQYPICVLDTSTDMWSVKSVLYHKSSHLLLFDMCHVKTSDGTPCLVFCFPYEDCVRMVEMISGKTRWELDRKYFGNNISPNVLCKNDAHPEEIYMLSIHKIMAIAIDDGTSLWSFNLKPIGITNPFCMRAHEDFIYVMHVKRNGETHSISKFTKTS